jgi:hypothetical protein
MAAEVRRRTVIELIDKYPLAKVTPTIALPADAASVHIERLRGSNPLLSIPNASEKNSCFYCNHPTRAVPGDWAWRPVTVPGGQRGDQAGRCKADHGGIAAI